MMKKLTRVLALILALILATADLSPEASSFCGIDAENADAGASLLLKNYLESDENASAKLAAALAPLESINASKEESGEEVSNKTAEEVLYETPIQGVACVESSLNIRAAATVLSEVVAKAYRTDEVTILGEKLANGCFWYKVEKDSVQGYCVADYIKFGEEASSFYEELHEIEKAAAEIPAELILYENPDDFGVPEDVQEKLSDYVKQINFTLANDYPAEKESGEYMNMYAILIYLLEYYQHVKDIAVEYNMIEAQAQCNIDIYTINLTRETLQDTTGQSDEELQAAIEEARAERYRNSVVGYGTSIADYAATFVGTLPYIWGGASLKSGADCSGFCAQIYAHFGLIDQGAANCHAYDSTALRSVGYEVSVNDILPGDLVCYKGHVAIYYGDGLIVHEPSVGKKCSFGYLYGLPIICVRRLHHKE